MQIYRLFVDVPLAAGACFALPPSQAHYVRCVVRLRHGDGIVLFNGVDGEWHATIALVNKKEATVQVQHQTRPQSPTGTVDVYFAPLKAARNEYAVQKMVEMGARSITPVKTQHTQSPHVNMDKLHTYCVEAAEQCGILSLPHLHAPTTLQHVLDVWPATHILVFCDESAPTVPLLTRLAEVPKHQQLALLIGPEGGFSVQERAQLHAHPAIFPISLGPRILRADTALVAALAALQLTHGDV